MLIAYWPIDEKIDSTIWMVANSCDSLYIIDCFLFSALFTIDLDGQWFEWHRENWKFNRRHKKHSCFFYSGDIFLILFIFACLIFSFIIFYHNIDPWTAYLKRKKKKKHEPSNEGEKRGDYSFESNERFY